MAQDFFLELGDALGLASDPDAALTAAAVLLCEEVSADGMVYAEIDPLSRLAVGAAEWRDGALSRDQAAGGLGELGPEFLASLASGRAVVVDDVSADAEGGSPATKAGFAARSIGAFVSAPLVRNVALAAIFTVCSSTARTWSAFEVDIVREVAERVHDAIARLRAEAEARSHRALLAALFEQAPVAIGVIDTSGRFILRNKRLDRYVTEAIPSRDVRNADRWTMFDPSGCKVGCDQFPAAQALRGATVAMEGKFRAFDEREAWISVAASPLRDEKGDVTGAVVIVTDIDQTKTG